MHCSMPYVIIECGICEKKLGDTANTYLAVSQQYVRYGNNLLNMISNHQRLINLTQQVRDDMLYITGEFLGR